MKSRNDRAENSCDAVLRCCFHVAPSASWENSADSQEALARGPHAASRWGALLHSEVRKVVPALGWGPDATLFGILAEQAWPIKRPAGASFDADTARRACYTRSTWRCCD